MLLPKLFLAILLGASITSCLAQDTSTLTDPAQETGYKPHGSFGFGDFDSINLMNLQLDLHIPIISYPQRGGNLQLGWELGYSNNLIQMSQRENSDGSYGPYEDVGPVAGLTINPLFGVNLNTLSGSGYPGSEILAPDGTHSISWTSTAQSFYEAIDASGWTATPNDARCPTSAPTSVVSPNGVINCGTELNLNDNESYPSVIKDTHGNSITLNGATFTDSIGRQIPALSKGFLGYLTDGAYSGSVAFATDFTGCSGPGSTTNALVLNAPGVYGQSLSYKFCFTPAISQGRIIVCLDPYLPSQNTGTPYADSTEEVGCPDGPAGAPPGTPPTPPFGTLTGQQFQSFVLPNKTSWTFQYDPVYGDLTSITTPAGGTVTYTWTNLTAMQGTCAEYDPYLQFARAIASRTVNANDGTGPHTWTYTQIPSGTPTEGTFGLPYGIKVTNPDNSYVIHHFSNIGGFGAVCGYYETSTQDYSAAGTLVRQQQKTYSSISIPSSLAPMATNVVQRSTSTTLDNGQVSQVQMDYDSGASVVLLGSTTTTSITLGSIVAKRTYDYGSGSPGPILSAEDTTYLWQSNSAYKTAGLTRLVASVCEATAGNTSCSGTTNSASYTAYGYDETGSPQGTIGNQTSIKRWLNTTGQMIPTSTTYNANGMPSATTDAKGNKIQYTYDSTGAFISKVQRPTTSGIAHISYYSYDSTTGLLLYHTDENGSNANDPAHTTTYSYDIMSRPTNAAYPDGGSQTLSFDDAIPPSVTFTEVTGESAGPIVKKVLYDGSGRMQQTQLTTDPSGIDYVDIVYDSRGRVGSTSNPYRSKSDPTYGITTNTYDVINRALTLTHSSDSSQKAWSYAGNQTTITDETGRKWKQKQDALGRVIQILEPDGTSGVGSTPTLETDYQYDPLGNLLRIDQWGGPSGSSGDRIRIVKYDSLSRLLNSCNPETIASGSSCGANGPWGTSYSYDLDGNVATRTDGRGIITDYTVDALNRLTQKAYTIPSPAPADYASTPTVNYSYDQTSFDGLTIANGVGLRTGMTDAAGKSAWSYDAMGRAVKITRTINSVTKTSTYAYDKAGFPTNILYYSGSNVSFVNNAAGQAISAVDSANGFNFVTSATYAPHGAISKFVNGNTGSFAGITTNESYNGRLELVLRSSATSSATDQSLSFGYATNGNILNIANNIDNTRSQSFQYDNMNRLSLAQAGTRWGDTYKYDQWGNLYQITAISGTSTAQTLLLTPTINNRLSGTAPTYDAAGNMSKDNQGDLYSYDAENRIVTAGGETYTYDGDGNRVMKTGGVVARTYWPGTVDEVLNEFDTSGGDPVRNVYLAGALRARRDNDGTINYVLGDQISSSRIVTNATGGVEDDIDYYPFGMTTDYSVSSSSNIYKFTGKERDAESGLDYFGARYYGSSMGRFLSPDPSGLLAQKPQDPQSWNLYVYARNNPLINIDPNGLDCIYATDSGKGVESIDHDSNSGECGQNGGTWLSGYVDEDWAHYNKTAGAFEAAAEDGSQVNFAQFQSGAQTNDSGGCLSGCGSYGFASTSADFLTGQLVGNSRPTDGSDPLDGLLTFMTGRDQAVTDFWKGVAGPINGKDNWAGPGGMGVPQGTGDWRAAVHDYNFNTNGITIGSYFNPTLSPATARALIQSNNNLMRTGGVQGAKEKMIFGPVNAFQWYANSWK